MSLPSDWLSVQVLLTFGQYKSALSSESAKQYLAKPKSGAPKQYLAKPKSGAPL